MNMSAWELFELITSAYYGKQYYFQEPDGRVYSRASHRYMTEREALHEFLDRLESVVTDWSVDE